MGCKFGNDQKEEEKNEIKRSVINILKEKDDINIEDHENTDSNINKNNEDNYDLEHYKKKLDEEKLTKSHLKSYINNDLLKNIYNNDVFQIINFIRTKPNSYANYIEDCMDDIIETGEYKDKKIVYKKQLKVELNRGEPAFREAVKILREMEPIHPLTLKQELEVPIPLSEYQVNNINYLKKEIETIRSIRKVDAYFKDTLNNPEISILLLFVDAYGDGGARRKIILNRDINYVGISSGKVGESFVAYFTFSR